MEPRLKGIAICLGLVAVGVPLAAYLHFLHEKQKTEARIRDYFEMDADMEVTPANIEAALSKKLRKGCSMEEVKEYLESRGIGRDEFSGFIYDGDRRALRYGDSNGPEFGCTVDIEPDEFLAPSRNWIKVYFVTDETNRLDSIEAVESGLGPTPQSPALPSRPPPC